MQCYHSVIKLVLVHVLVKQIQKILLVLEHISIALIIMNLKNH